MGKSDNLHFEFENEQGVYIPGQAVRGRLHVTLSQATNVREIRLEFDGRAYCHWSTGSSNRRTDFIGREDYCEATIPLFGRGLGMGEGNNLPEGQYVYPFSFVLPPGLPSSFEDPWRIGFIRYTLKGIIEKRGFNYSGHVLLRVMSPVDLSFLPNITTPISNRQEKFLCCFCCKSGPITAMLQSDRIGFVLGESIPFQAEIQNMSKRACTVQMNLIMNISYHVKRVTKILPTLAAQVLYPGNITPGETEIWSGGQLLIPSDLPPSHFPGCQIMNIHYSLQLVVLPAGPATQLKVPIDILIGSIPIRFNQQRQVEQLPLSPPPYQDPPPTQPASTSTSGANLLLTQLAQLSYIEALRNEEGEVTQ
ncbi:arrestin domain-containing protein 17-like [Crassostrea angulata]|uniref:arrestin domain-containing protein 17-like n=1 Tax=Magallana angulata TaxID=2784310 RepID=UPI0022B0E636|nr:arrestin domain-containing protein 17-like [Crassostrea angulata]